jgi:hypothetical protein
MDLSSNMDAQPSFSSQELVVNPDGQSAALHNTTSSHFIQSFQSFGNIHGVEMPGSALDAGETFSKLVVVDNLLDRYDAPSASAYQPLSSHSRGSAGITLRLHGIHLDRLIHGKTSNIGALAQSHAYNQRRS